MKQRPYARRRPDGAEIRFMAAADGYAMVRMKGCFPFIVPIAEWNGWPEIA
jgi:hypothetical protein